MGLIDDLESFLATSLEDPDFFGWPVTITNLLGESQDIYGQARHINLVIDMETGVDIQTEQASVVLRLSSITIGEPEKNWKVTTTDTNGTSRNFYVVEAMPDRTAGLIILKLGNLT